MREDGLEEVFLEFLKAELVRAPLDLLDQAEHYRSRRQKVDWKFGAEKAVTQTADSLARNVVPVIEQERKSELIDLIQVVEPVPEALVQRQVREIVVDGDKWTIIIELTDDPAVLDWLTITSNFLTESNEVANVGRSISMRIAMQHPFMQNYCGLSNEEIEPIVRLAAAFALSEEIARESGVLYAATFRRILNKIMRDALAN